MPEVRRTLRPFPTPKTRSLDRPVVRRRPRGRGRGFDRTARTRDIGSPRTAQSSTLSQEAAGETRAGRLTRCSVSTYRGSRHSPDWGTAAQGRHFWRRRRYRCGASSQDGSTSCTPQLPWPHWRSRQVLATSRTNRRPPRTSAEKERTSHASEDRIRPGRAGHAGDGCRRWLQARVRQTEQASEPSGSPASPALPEGFVVSGLGVVGRADAHWTLLPLTRPPATVEASIGLHVCGWGSRSPPRDLRLETRSVGSRTRDNAFA